MLSVEVYQITQTLKIKEDIGHSKKKGGEGGQDMKALSLGMRIESRFL